MSKTLSCQVVFFVIIFYSCSNPPKEKNNYFEHVGNTEYNPKIDTTKFEPCHDDQILEYYNFSNGLQYVGEKIAIEEVFREKYEHPTSEGQTGYITIRFVVNCKSETGWFRIEQMDNAYQIMEFKPLIVDKLLSITKSLKVWKTGKFNDPDYENEVYDYYQYLTFKMKDGQIIEILP